MTKTLNMFTPRLHTVGGHANLQFWHLIMDCLREAAKQLPDLEPYPMVVQRFIRYMGNYQHILPPNDTQARVGSRNNTIGDPEFSNIDNVRLGLTIPGVKILAPGCTSCSRGNITWMSNHPMRWFYNALCLYNPIGGLYNLLADYWYGVRVAYEDLPKTIEVHLRKSEKLPDLNFIVGNEDTPPGFRDCRVLHGCLNIHSLTDFVPIQKFFKCCNLSSHSHVRSAFARVPTLPPQTLHLLQVLGECVDKSSIHTFGSDLDRPENLFSEPYMSPPINHASFDLPPVGANGAGVSSCLRNPDCVLVGMSHQGKSCTCTSCKISELECTIIWLKILIDAANKGIASGRVSINEAEPLRISLVQLKSKIEETQVFVCTILEWLLIEAAMVILLGYPIAQYAIPGFSSAWTTTTHPCNLRNDEDAQHLVDDYFFWYRVLKLGVNPHVAKIIKELNEQGKLPKLSYSYSSRLWAGHKTKSTVLVPKYLK